MRAEIETLADWSEPIQKDGKWVRYAVPNSYFWDYWKANKDELKSNGVKVTKLVYGWQASYWTATNGHTKTKKTNKLKHDSKLLPYQKGHVIQLLNAIAQNNCVLDASDTGTGKSYAACAVGLELNRPIFVICPKSVISIWIKVAKFMGVELEGCLNYEKLKTGKTDYMTKDLKYNLDNNNIIVFDESHKCKSYNSINAKMMIAAKKQGYTVLALSATIADNPLQMRAIGYLLDLYPTLKDYWNWAFRHGVTKEPVYIKDRGGDTRDVIIFNHSVSVLEKIHNSIFPNKGSRMQISVLGDVFPETQISAECYETSSSKKIQKIYDEMERELSFLKLASKDDVDDEHPLTIVTRARQRIELLKVPVFVELAQDYLAENHSVVIFVNFEETLQAIGKKLKTDCFIHGNQSNIQRDAAIESFQNDSERVIVANIKAGGVGVSLHDLNGKHSRVSLVSPTYSAQDLVQALGRVHRAGGKSKSLQRIIFAADTIEEEVAAAVMKKIDRIKMLNDGDLTSSINIQ